MCIRDALCDLIPFVQYKKPKKHPWRSSVFIEVAVLDYLQCFLDIHTPVKPIYSQLSING